MSIHHIRAAIAAALFLEPEANMAAGPIAPVHDKVAPTQAPGDLMAHSDRQRMKPWVVEKEQLQRLLKPGEGKDFYTRTLAGHGDQLTSINADQPDDLEYEVVKAPNAYEVRLELDQAGAQARKVNVATNLWRSDATEKALANKKP